MTDIPGGEGGFELGRAFVSVVPDASDFVQALDEEIGGLQTTVRVTPDTSDFAAAVDEQLGGLSAVVKVTADTTEAVTQVDSFLEDVSNTSPVITLGVDTDEALGQVDAFVADAEAEIASIGDEPVIVSIIPDMGDFDDALAEGLGGGGTVSVAADGEEAVEGLAASMDGLAGSTEGATEALGEFDGAMAGSGGAISTLGAEVDELGGKIDALAAGFGASVAGHLGEISGVASALEGTLQDALSGQIGDDLEISVPVVPEMSNFADAVAEGAGGVEVQVDTVPDMSNFESAVKEETGLEVRVDAVPNMEEFEALAQAQANSMSVTLKTVPEMDESDLGGSASAGQNLKIIAGDYDDITESANAATQASSQLNNTIAASSDSADALDGVAAGMNGIQTEANLAAKEAELLAEKAASAAEAADGMGASSSAAAAGVTDLGTAADLVTGRVTQLLGSADSSEYFLENFGGAASTAAQDLEQLSDKFADLSGTADELTSNIGGLYQQFATFASGTDLYSGQIANMSQDMETLGSRAAEIESVFTEVDSAFDSGAADADGLAAVYGRLSSSVGALQGDLAQVSSAFSGAIAPMTDAQEVADRLGVSLQDVGTASANMESNLRDAEQVSASMDALSGSATTVATAMDSDSRALQGFLSSLTLTESDVAALAAGQEAAAAAATEMAASEAAATEGMTAFQELTSGGMVQMMAQMFTDPLVGLVALTAAIGVAGVKIADYENSQNDLLATMQKQDQATGENITGYQQLSTQLTGAAGAAVATSIANQNATTSYESMHDGINNLATAIPAVTAAQQAAQTAATNLSTNLGTLEQTYGLTQQQAEQLATAAGVSAKQLDSSGTSANDAMSKIEAYANANESAMGPVGELSNDMSTFSNNALTASTRVNALDDAYNLLVGNFVTAQQATLSVSQDFLTISSNAQQAGASMTGTNSASVQLQQSFYSTVPAIEQAANAMVKQGDSTQQVNSYIDQQVTKLQGLTGGNQQAETAVQGLKQWEDQLKTSTDNLDTSITKAAQDIENQYTQQVTNAGVQSGTAKTDVENLTTAIQNNGTQSSQYQSARAQLISDLEKAGDTAQQATTLVNGLTNSIQQIPTTKDVTIDVNGQGQWTVHEEAGVTVPTAMSGTTAHLATTGAGGGVIPGFSPGNDVVPAMLSPGEGVLVPEAVQALGEDTVHQLNAMYSGGARPSTGALKRFAAGGIAGSSSLSSMPAYISSNYNSTVTQGENLVLGAILNAEGFAKGGVVQIPHYATGGVVWDAAAAGSAYGHNTANMTAMDTMAMQGQMINGSSMPYATGAAARNISVSFNGITSFPNPEQIQAIQLALSAAVGVS